MFSLAHFSDIHIGPMPKISKVELLSKRITGHINWQRNRARSFSTAILNNLAAHILQKTPDHIALTGDLINIGLNAEIARAARWLDSLEQNESLTICCGNHDAYVRRSLELCLHAWQKYLIGDDKHPIQSNADFPILRRRGPLSIIICNSGIATPPFQATGKFDKDQADKLERLLAQESGRCRVVMIHHPPFKNATKRHKRLHGDNRFRDAVKASGAELVLHGHTHIVSRQTIEGPIGLVPVIGVPAAGQGTGERRPAARYNWFDIAQNNDNWDISMCEYGYLSNNRDIVQITKPKLIS